MKQLVLGGVLMLGGAVMIVALMQKPQLGSDAVGVVNTPQAMTEGAKGVNDGVPMYDVPIATVDYNTEAKLRNVKQQDRERLAAEQERKALELIAEQKAAAELAESKFAVEEQGVADNLTVEARPEAVELAQRQAAEEAAQQQTAQQARDQKLLAQKRAKEQTDKASKQAAAKKSEVIKADKENKTVDKTVAEATKDTDKNRDNPAQKSTKAAKNNRHTVEKGDTLIRLSRQYGISVDLIAAANNMNRDDTLKRGATIKIPSQSELDNLRQKAAAAQKMQNADARLADARKKAKDGGGSSYGVQVALLSDRAHAETLAKKLRAAGYRPKIVPSNKGIRVLAGNEKNREAANALRDKVRSDRRLDESAKGAWVYMLN